MLTAPRPGAPAGVHLAPRSRNRGTSDLVVRKLPSPAQVTVLGSTGSIGVSTLDVIAAHPERFRVFALAAHRSVDALLEQCLRHAPRFAAMADPGSAGLLRERLEAAGSPTRVLDGAAGIEEIAGNAEADVVMAAIVGAAGLPGVMAAARAGRRILLANKEALVMSGALLCELVERNGAELVPIDSEHNAIFQCLPAGVCGRPEQLGVRRILLTASGGPFLDTPVEALAGVTPEQACAHPNWDMGRKISVDSATMMNKGLELIEACYLFDASPAQVEIVIHPQSIVHSMVEYLDGSVLAQLGNPDMRTPIANGLAWPERIESGVTPLDLVSLPDLRFDAPDPERFPCLSLARDALAGGRSLPVYLNAANEVAVQAFLQGAIRFTDIPRVIAATLEAGESCDPADLDEVMEQDRWARSVAEQRIGAL